jgi:hypothetical protein
MSCPYNHRFTPGNGNPYSGRTNFNCSLTLHPTGIRFRVGLSEGGGDVAGAAMIVLPDNVPHSAIPHSSRCSRSPGACAHDSGVWTSALPGRPGWGCRLPARQRFRQRQVELATLEEQVVGLHRERGSCGNGRTPDRPAILVVVNARSSAIHGVLLDSRGMARPGLPSFVATS